MIVSRRRFLKILIGVASAGTAGYIVARYARIWFTSRFEKLVAPVLQDSSKGELSAQAVQTMLAVTETIAVPSIDKGHYEDFFRWRSKNLPGYKRLYEQFVTTINYLARRRFVCDFADCDIVKRRRVLLENIPTDKLGKLRMSIFKKDWMLFEKYIFREILSLFSRTDALVLLGYRTWSGRPRGLSKYRQAR